MKSRIAAASASVGFKLLCAGGFLAVAIPIGGLLVRQPAEATVQASAPAKLASTSAVRTPAAVRAAVPAVEPVADPFVVKRVLKIDGPFRHGDFVWDDAGVPPGPIVITADIAAQTISVFRGGYEIGAAVILYGADDMPTPLGVFAISQKDADHVSNLYDAPMPYMLRLTNDGVAIHGSPLVDIDSATRGCIGVPVAFAKKLFAQAKLGDKVIVTKGEMLDVGGRIDAT